MGGENEKTISAKRSEEGTQISDIRMHQSAGEVHFHDDKKGFKCAMPVSDFFAAWRRNKHELLRHPFSLIGSDGKGGHATITFTRHKKSELHVQVDPIT